MINENKAGRINSSTNIFGPEIYHSITHPDNLLNYERIIDLDIEKYRNLSKPQFIVLPCLYAKNHWRLYAFDLANQRTLLFDPKPLTDKYNQDDFNLIKDTFLGYWHIANEIEHGNYKEKKHIMNYS